MVTDPTEITRKMPVWHALSELFLDTELQPEDYRRISDRMSASGYSSEQLRQILEKEVAPAFVFNLLDVAGEWTPWSEAQVAEIVARSSRASALRRWLDRRLFRKYVADEWAKIAPLLET